MYKDVIEMDLTPDSIQELTILLDKIVDTPEKDSEDFKKLCLDYGHSILYFAKEIGYPRYDAFETVYMKKSTEFLMEDMAKRREIPADRAFGCRDPSTTLGSWSKAYVFCQQGDTRVGAVFDGGKDYVGHPTLEEAGEQYAKFLEDGWVPMTTEDIIKTSGITVGDDTDMTVTS